MACFVFVVEDNEYDGMWVVSMCTFELAGMVC